jgi:transposase
MAEHRELQPIHYQAMQLRLEGLTIKQIAERLGKGHDTIHKWFYAREDFREAFSKLKEETVQRAFHILVNHAPDAARSVVDLSKGKAKKSKDGSKVSARTQLDAAKDILDRVGLKPVERQQVEATVDQKTEYVAEWGTTTNGK